MMTDESAVRAGQDVARGGDPQLAQGGTPPPPSLDPCVHLILAPVPCMGQTYCTTEPYGFLRHMRTGVSTPEPDRDTTLDRVLSLSLDRRRVVPSKDACAKHIVPGARVLSQGTVSSGPRTNFYHFT